MKMKFELIIKKLKGSFMNKKLKQIRMKRMTGRL
jgi:hypothetical protein